MHGAPTALSRLEQGRGSAFSDLDRLTVSLLWKNPGWLSYRLNFLAFRFNDPIFRHVESRHGLVRPEFVALYAIGLLEGVAAKNIASASGLPKNTLSRAIQKLLTRRLIRRELDRDDLRSFVLELTEAGRAIVEATKPVIMRQQDAVLASLDEAEQRTLCELLDKLVIASSQWPSDLDEDAGDPPAARS